MRNRIKKKNNTSIVILSGVRIKKMGGGGGGSTWLGQIPKFFQKIDLKASLMCYNQCSICTVLKAPCKKCCAIGHCYYFSGTSVQTLAQLGLIQGNSRCSGANFQMSQNTHFLC